MKWIISFGKLELKYFIMIGSAIGLLFLNKHSYPLYSKEKKEIIKAYFKKVGISVKESDIKNNNALLKSFLKYLGFSLFIIGEIIRKKLSRKEKESETNILSMNNTIKKNLGQNKNDEKYKINRLDIIFMSCISIALLLNEFLAIAIKSIYGLDTIHIDEIYNTIEFTFLFFTSYLIFKLRYYKHQYLSIIIIIILEILRIIIKKKDMNTIKNAGLQVIRAFIDSIFIGYSKALMEYKYFSPYKALYIFGFINVVILLVISIIVSFIPVGDSSFCQIMHEGKCYFDNIGSIFNEFSFVQFIGLFLYMISASGIQLLFNFIANNYTICHIFPYYIVYNFSGIFKYDSIVLILLIIFCIIEFLIAFIFLEIIVLNFCGLEEYVKVNIEKRARLDTIIVDDKGSFDINEEYSIDNAQNEGEKKSSLKETPLLPIINDSN